MDTYIYMKDFKRGGFNDRGGDRGGRPSFGGDRPRFGGDKPRFGGKPGFKKFNDRDARPGRGGDDKPMFPANCSECGKSCQVPFRPNGEKPVLCDNCFSAKKEAQSHGFGDRFEKRDSFSTPKPDYRINDLKAQVDHLTSKVDKVLVLLESYQRSSDSVKKSPSEVAQKPITELAKTVQKVSDSKPAKKQTATAAKKASAKAPAKKTAKKATKKK